MPSTQYIDMPMAAYETTRVCRSCGQEKDTEECFRLLTTYRNKKRYRGYAGRCKKCDVIAQREYVERTGKADTYSHRQQVARYGITPLEYAEMLMEQAGVCAICRQPERGERRLAIDHCYKTGKVRGLLCRECNNAIGKLKDSPELCLAAFAYLHIAEGGE